MTNIPIWDKSLKKDSPKSHFVYNSSICNFNWFIKEWFNRAQ